MDKLTTDSFYAAFRRKGPYTECMKSLKFHGAPPIGLRKSYIDGWEPVSHRAPHEGWEYGLAKGCINRGGIGSASWQYWRLAGRKICES